MSRRVTVIICAILLPVAAASQEVGGSMHPVPAIERQADSLHMAYDFGKAVECYDKALESQSDSLIRHAIEDKKVHAENGLNLQKFASSPIVVASHRFSLEDFFLFYPLKDRSWRAIPNKLDSLAHPIVKATYVPEGEDKLCYSTQDDEDFRNLYWTEFKDSTWTAPTLLNEGLTSTGDEIYPMLSPDGKTLYFSSNGLYGVGGYDIYETKWDEELGDWGIPVNMGFPYSSPADDFLYMDSEDGKYSIFASNRDCSRDSVTVYVVEFDSMPLHRSIESPEELRDLAGLHPVSDHKGIDNGSTVSNDMPDNVDTRNYVEKMRQVKVLRDSLNNFEKTLDEHRSELASSEDESIRANLTSQIIKQEEELPQLQEKLQKASEDLQKIEMDFLFKGVVLDPEKLLEQADHKVVGQSTSYAFTGMHYGGSLEGMKIDKPVHKIDYSFKILDKARLADNSTLPDGIVYQIQLFSSSSKATIEKFKGLSPVFETKNSSGSYVYRAGVFRHYKSALEQLNKVKRVGFKDAFISAYRDGKATSVTQARKIEASTPDKVNVVIVPNGDALPAGIVSAIRDFCEKDVVKSFESGHIAFVVGPFTDTDQAEELSRIIRNAGMSNVSVSRIDSE